MVILPHTLDTWHVFTAALDRSGSSADNGHMVEIAHADQPRVQVDGPGGGSSTQPAWPVLVLGGLAAIVLVAAAAVGVGDADERLAGSGNAFAAAPDDRASRAAAEESVRAFVQAVAAGYSAGALAELAPSQPQIADEPAPRRSVQWPLIYGTMDWWVPTATGSRLDERQVMDFVRYFRMTPGGLFVGDCESRVTSATGPEIITDCDYSAFGGMPALIGRDDAGERGILTFTVVAEAIVAVERERGPSDGAWLELAEWVATERPESFAVTFGALGGTRLLDPTYTGDSAIEHAELAAEFAREMGRLSQPIG